MRDHISAQQAALIDSLKNASPQGNEIARILENLDNPVADEPSKDRYVALVASHLVQMALKAALGPSASDKTPLSSLIDMAKSHKIVTQDQAKELHRIREIRNAFAHSIEPVSFSTPIVSEITRELFHHPISSWAGYFATTFEDRAKFAIICGEFFNHLSRKP